MLKSILIINQPLGNRGDEAAHRAFVRSLNNAFPQAHIDIVWIGAPQKYVDEFIVDHPNNNYINLGVPHDYFAKGFGEGAMRCGCSLKVIATIHPILHKLKSYYLSADLVLCAPGGICMGGFQDWVHLFFLEMAKTYHRPLGYYSRSFGPFPTKTWQNKQFKKKSIELLHYFCKLSIRDKKTMALADEMHIPYIPSIDAAFLERPSVASSIMKQKDNYIVFVPNKLTWHYAYRHYAQEIIDDFYLSILSQLLAQYPNHRVIMLPQTSSTFGNKNSDYYYFVHLRNRSQHSRQIEIIPDTCGSDEQQTIIHGASLVVGARYHSIVFAINNARPFIALNYEHKIEGLLDILELKKYKVDITNIFSSKRDMSKALKQFADLLTQPIDYDTEEKYQKAHMMANSGFQLFFNSMF
ncbi:MAG: polysaccharide pyruvyl transferase family protein [Paludibacteraceae bacterium]